MTEPRKRVASTIVRIIMLALFILVIPISIDKSPNLPVVYIRSRY